MRHARPLLLAALTWALAHNAISEEIAVVEADNDSDEPRAVFITVNVPSDVALFDRFIVDVLVQNRRASEDFILEDIDIALGYLRGFSLIKVTPEQEEISGDEETLTLTLNLLIGA